MRASGRSAGCDEAARAEYKCEWGGDAGPFAFARDDEGRQRARAQGRGPGQEGEREKGGVNERLSSEEGLLSRVAALRPENRVRKSADADIAGGGVFFFSRLRTCASHMTDARVVRPGCETLSALCHCCLSLSELQVILRNA